MNTGNPPHPVSGEHIPRLIHSLRDQRVILDADLARLYGIETRALNQAMKRNLRRFPADFIFDLNREEILRISQSVTSLSRLKFSKQVRAFTEHGALMAAMVLSSPRAVAMSVYVIRAFVQMREEQAANAALLKRLAEIDRTLLQHDAATALFEALGYRSEKRLPFNPNTPDNFLATFAQGRKLNPELALLADWESVDFLFQLTDDEVRAAAGGNQHFLFDSKGQYNGAAMESYIFFAIAPSR